METRILPGSFILHSLYHFPCQPPPVALPEYKLPEKELPMSMLASTYSAFIESVCNQFDCRGAKGRLQGFLRGIRHGTGVYGIVPGIQRQSCPRGNHIQQARLSQQCALGISIPTNIEKLSLVATGSPILLYFLHETYQP